MLPGPNRAQSQSLLTGCWVLLGVFTKSAKSEKIVRPSISNLESHDIINKQIRIILNILTDLNQSLSTLEVSKRPPGSGSFSAHIPADPQLMKQLDMPKQTQTLRILLDLIQRGDEQVLWILQSVLLEPLKSPMKEHAADHQ
ncbi:hypothetical protein CHARACLAT_000249 [Characodon lateralis]|uniref:Uncharacterized protein n=1 Tax=Characodon lateralis TaxID=208331 RepID=A0ABU7DM08_9TELE|nr:hypothetical protein [Characodon lateralis]